MVDVDGDNLLCVLQASVKDILAGKDHAAELGGFTFQPTIAKQAKLEYRAEASFEPLWEPAEYVEDDDMCVCVSLANLTQRRSTPKKKPRRHRVPNRLY